MSEALMTMTQAKYDALPGVNFSLLKEIAKSPKHYRHRCLVPRPDEDFFALGRCVHMAVLEPERFSREVVCWPKVNGDRRGKKWAEFQADHYGSEILKQDDYALCMNLQASVRGDREAARLLTGGVAERTVLWTDSFTQLQCKCRPDYVTPSALIDIKTTARDASPFGFGRESWRRQYHTQMAFYQDGLAANSNGILLPVYIVAVEKAPPFVVQVYHLTEDLLAKGREEYLEMLSKLSFCKSNDVWDGYSDHGDIVELEPPAWAMDVDDDEDVSELGLEVG